MAAGMMLNLVTLSMFTGIKIFLKDKDWPVPMSYIKLGIGPIVLWKI